MIKTEQVREALKEDNMYVVVDFITQQEKVNELLELYRNLSMETRVKEREIYWNKINKLETEL